MSPENNNKTRITLIGGSGFVGSRLISLLHKDNRYIIKNIDLRPSYFHNDITEIGDVRKQEELIEYLKDTDIVILLAAMHRDDISPISLYYETNVEGMKNTLQAMNICGVKQIVFFSSVAVYGLDKNNPDESYDPDPSNDYGKSKLQAEVFLKAWQNTHPDLKITVIRPTVIFGERNRGNVYNLLKQIVSGRFAMIGRGENRKSMAYVGNIVAFVKFILEKQETLFEIYNYVDKPDFTMKALVEYIECSFNRKVRTIHLPYIVGLMAGYFFDVLAFIMQKRLLISSVRVKKFCATTEFDALKVQQTGFVSPYTLKIGLARTIDFEFVNTRSEDVVFKSE